MLKMTAFLLLGFFRPPIFLNILRAPPCLCIPSDGHKLDGYIYSINLWAGKGNARLILQSLFHQGSYSEPDFSYTVPKGKCLAMCGRTLGLTVTRISATGIV